MQLKFVFGTMSSYATVLALCSSVCNRFVGGRVEKFAKNESSIAAINALRTQTSGQEKKIEEDSEREIFKLSSSHQREMKALIRSNILLGNEKDILQQRHETMLEDLKELQEQVASQRDKIRSSEEAMAALENDIEADGATIADKKREILAQEADICFYSQENLEQNHCNIDLVDARLKLEESLTVATLQVKEKEAEVDKMKSKLKVVTNTGQVQRAELNGLQMKLKQMQEMVSSMRRKGEEKKQALVDLENGVTEAMSHDGDHKCLKSRVCSLSKQFLQSSNRREAGKVVTNGEKILSIDNKITSIRATIERKKKTHEKEMQRLKRENSTLQQELHSVSQRRL